MKRVNVLHDIVPLTEFRSKMAELIEQLKRTQSPIVLTQHGRAVAVVMPPAEYEELAYRDEFVKAVREGIADAEAGNLIPHEEVVAMFAAERELRESARKAGGSLSEEEFQAALARADQKMARKYARKGPKGKAHAA